MAGSLLFMCSAVFAVNYELPFTSPNGHELRSPAVRVDQDETHR